VLLSAAGAALVAAAEPAVAARALRVICAVPAGGPPDRLARAYASRLVVPGADRAFVENRPGGGGIIAVAALRQSLPDGSSLLLGHSGLVTMLPFAHPQLPYDATLDLVPVSTAAELGFAFAAGPLVPAAVRNVAEYAHWAGRNENLSTIASAGHASALHLLAVLLAQEAGFVARQVVYAGGPQALVDVLGGRVAGAVLPEGLLRPLHESGQLRVLATAGRVRSELLPQVPTFVEQGLPKLELRDWFGFFAPRGTPEPVIEDAAGAIRRVASSPELRAELASEGWTVLGSTPEAMRARLLAETPRWRAMIVQAGIRAQ
jgi:tripartite-type tricarboxylate transporter receptor subunit TctC